ncbi:heparan-alpha-glucosaminide N-acetyltransferase-like isoform X1 [Panicum miliaceum]|uniref:Heparan-alpha-glucosaminide N-acetyltransferase-like isoform X1 n=1 Tax=Panicum miliaceum TaxID=4540 RepID=A0A3L6PR76_PANMI|nr:heparan-alpha-glucosaminide N-acetyltransferase-like isoform X1 [Panicum miliaceum]
MGAAAGNAGGAAPTGTRGGRRPGAMGGYELVRSDDAPALAVDLEAGGGGPAKRAAGTSPAPAPARQRLVSLDVFRGITVLLLHLRSALFFFLGHTGTATPVP